MKYNTIVKLDMNGLLAMFYRIILVTGLLREMTATILLDD